MESRGRYRLVHEGRRYDVELVPDGRGARAALLVDGERVDERPAPWPLGAKLEHGEERITVRWWRPGHVLTLALVVPPEKKPADGEKPAEGEKSGEKSGGKGEEPGKRRELVPFEPLPGTQGAAVPRFQYEHPRLFASRHVVAAVVQVLVGVLGVFVVLPRLFAWIPWPDIDLPDVNLPDLPDLPDLPNLWGWLPDVDLPDLPAVPGWIQALAQSWKYWGPILIAIFVASSEVSKRRARTAEASTPPDTRSEAPGTRGDAGQSRTDEAQDEAEDGAQDETEDAERPRDAEEREN